MDDRGRENGAGLLASYGYDGLGRRVSLVRANGASTSWSYDAAGRLASLTQDLTGTAQDLTVTYDYNPAGQVASRTASNDTYAFTGNVNGTAGYTSDGLSVPADPTAPVVRRAKRLGFVR